MSDVLAALAGPAVQTLGNIGLGTLSRSWENEDWKNRTNVLNQLAKENIVDEPRLHVQGLEAAGLNPALANSGSFGALAPQQGSTSTQSMSMQAPDFSKLAQNRLLEAQAKKTESEAKSIDIDLKRKGYEDATHAENMHEFFKVKSNEREKELREKYPNMKPDELGKLISDDPWYRYFNMMSQRMANAGTTQAYRDFTSLLREDNQAGYEVIHFALQKLIEKGQMNKDILDTLIYAPNHNREEQLHKIALMLAQTWSAQASGDASYHNDLAAMLKNKDKLGAFVYGGEKVLDFIDNWSPLMWLRALRGSKGQKVAKTTEKSFDRLKQIDRNSSAFPKF